MTNPGVWGATLGDTNSMYLTLSANEEYFKSMSSHPDQTIDIREKLVRPALDALSASLRSKDYVTGKQRHVSLYPFNPLLMISS